MPNAAGIYRTRERGIGPTFEPFELVLGALVEILGSFFERSGVDGWRSAAAAAAGVLGVQLPLHLVKLVRHFVRLYRRVRRRLLTRFTNGKTSMTR